MSSSNGKVLINEVYPTPPNAVRALIDQLIIKPTDLFLEPCRAEGTISNLINLPEEQKYWAEIRQGVDYLATPFPKMDIIITNPPFSLTCEFLRKSFSELHPEGVLAYLQRVNYLGTIKRLPFWEEVGYPNKLPVLVPRPSFVQGETDSCEYAWFIYDRGNRFPFIKKGVSNITWDKVKLK